MLTTAEIREQLAELRALQLEGDLHPVAGTLELIGSSFLVDEPTLFGKINDDYVQRELEWYMSMSRYVGDIPGKTPKIWEQVASGAGYINSNYGWMMWSHDNGSQMMHVLETLREKPTGRQAVAIYTRPTMHTEWNRDGMSDFVCTNAVNYFIRDGGLHAVVQMRSNDAVFGFRNDYAWQKWLLDGMARDLGVNSGEITWQAASLHIYERHWGLLDDYLDGKGHAGSVAARE